MKPVFKYQSLLDLVPNCPPSGYREISVTAFRFVHAQNHPDNFKPVQLIYPSRKFEDDDTRCKALGLSFFTEKNKARLTFQKISAKSPSFAKTVGEHIATISISPEDGAFIVPKETNSGHFTFHEYIGCDFQQKIENIEPIIKQ
ncbi:MAG: hypothetical protein DYG98_15625 [Haliscomenobacteraceae bacterium CHB4]|nr:hypothetical protein [Haliscomenobacteraceae bacterium CHB4]